MWSLFGDGSTAGPGGQDIAFAVGQGVPAGNLGGILTRSRCVAFQTDGDGGATVQWVTANTGANWTQVGAALPVGTSASGRALADDDGLLLCTVAGQAYTVPTAVGRKGKLLTVKNLTTGTVTPTATGAETIDGLATWPLQHKMAAVTLISDGANWHVVYSYAQRPSWKDQIGQQVQVPNGAAAPVFEAYEDTGHGVYWLRYDRDEEISIALQLNHDRRVGTAIGSLHIHWTAGGNGSGVVRLRVRYKFVAPNGEVGVLADWTETTVSLTVTALNHYRAHAVSPLIASIAAPPGDGSSAILLVHVTRMGTSDAADTYETLKTYGTGQANFGVWGIDVHYLSDRPGSFQEFSE